MVHALKFDASKSLIQVGWALYVLVIACAYGLIVVVADIFLMETPSLSDTNIYRNVSATGYTALWVIWFMIPLLLIACWILILKFCRGKAGRWRRAWFSIASIACVFITAYMVWVVQPPWWEDRPLPHLDRAVYAFVNWHVQYHTYISLHNEMIRMIMIGYAAAGVVLLVTLLFPMRMLINTIRITDASRCEKCGYDMRGSIMAGHVACPECGHIPDLLPRSDAA